MTRRIVAAGVLAALTLSLGGAGDARGHLYAAGADVRAAQSPTAPEPPLLATPQGKCGPGSRPETGIQGRVSPEDHESGRAAKGFTCNTELVGSYRKPNAIGTVGRLQGRALRRRRAATTAPTTTRR